MSHPSRIAAGATVEREVPMPLGQGEFVHLELNSTDFSTAQQMVEAINRMAPGTALAADGRQVRVKAPTNVDERVSFIGRIENLEVAPAKMAGIPMAINVTTGMRLLRRACLTTTTLSANPLARAVRM